MKLVLRFLTIIGLFFLNSAFADNTKDSFRTNFQKWVTYNQVISFEEQKALVKSLQDYSLYPYVATQFFQNNIKTVSPEEVSEFVAKYNDLPVTSSLTQSFLAELTSRQDWNAIVSFPRDNSTATNCRYQYALFQQGNNQSLFTTIEDLWKTGKELPSACDPLLDVWVQAGKRTSNLILLRIGLAVEANNIKFARYLTNLLNNDYKTTKDNLLALLDNPQKLADFSKNIKASSFTKQIVLATFPRLVRVNNNLAQTLLPQLAKQQTLSETEVDALQKSLANSYFNNNTTDEQIKWRDEYITQSHDTALIEKRIRLAIDEYNYTDIAYWLTQLSPEAKSKEDWQYWQARVLLNNNQKKEAEAILKALSSKRGFYGMISAQTLNQTYSLKNLSRPISKTEIKELEAKYNHQSFVKRIEELRYWGMLSESNREWRYMLNNNATNNEYLDLAKFAFIRDWGDLCIQATIAGKLWDNWNERLPIMYQKFYKDALKDKAIPLSYTLAISRQESALDTTVQSPVGASGLMQLMPNTAKETAKKVSSVIYYSPTQLFEPQTNIELGTYFLNNMYLTNNNNRILSSAAYNAGPNRVKLWLNNSGGKLDAVAFIDSIPFTETRNYVKNVLVYDYIYQIILGKPNNNILTENEINRQY